MKRLTKKIKLDIYKKVLNLIETNQEEFMCTGIYNVMLHYYGQKFTTEHDVSQKRNRSKWKDFYSHIDKNVMTAVDVERSGTPWFICNPAGIQSRIEILQELILKR